MIKDFRKTIKKNGQFSFILHFATSTHCNFKFLKIDPPYCTVYVQYYVGLRRPSLLAGNIKQEFFLLFPLFLIQKVFFL